MPVDVSLPLRKIAHGPCAQLHHRRRDRALPAHARQERVAADGLGCLRAAGGKRRHGQRCATGQVDLRQHCLHEAAAEVARLRHRLEPRAGHLPSGILPLESVVILAHAGTRPGVQKNRRGELGSRGSDGAGQRASDRRTRLAHRRGHRKARDTDVLPRDHALYR